MSQIIPPTDFNASKNHKFTKNIFGGVWFFRLRGASLRYESLTNFESKARSKVLLSSILRIFKCPYRIA